MAGISFLARRHVTIVRHAGETRDRGAKLARKRQEIKTNMAARGFFRARLLLSLFKRNSRISMQDCITSTTSVNSLNSTKTVCIINVWGCAEILPILPQVIFSSQILQTFTNFTQHLLKGYWSPSCLIHRQLHQRGHRESHGRREYWPPSLNNSTKKTAKNKDKSPRKSLIKKLNFLQFRSLAIPTFGSILKHRPTLYTCFATTLVHFKTFA